MESQWMPEPQDLGALGLAGICRDTSRLVRQVIVPSRPSLANLGPMVLSALLLANAAACSVLRPRVASVSVLDDGSTPFRFVADCTAAFTVWLWLDCTAAYALCVASLYRTRTGENFLIAFSDFKFRRLLFTFLFVAVPFLKISTSWSATVALLQVRLDVATVLKLRLVGWACAAYVTVVGQLACVVSVLEVTTCFGAVRRSRELLVGKFMAAGCVFLTLDGCFLAMLKAFTVLVMDDALGFGLWFQVAAGAAMFVALYAVLVVALVAQPVVYIACKNHLA